MKRITITLAFALIAPLAFAQTSSTTKRERVSASEGVTVTGTIITDTEDGAAANFQPVKTLVIREDGATKPGRYVINGRGRVVNKAGYAINTAVKPGARVRVYFTGAGDSRTVDHVVVLD